MQPVARLPVARLTSADLQRCLEPLWGPTEVIEAGRRQYALDLVGELCNSAACEWMPRVNRCWFAARVVGVKRKYGLTVDRGEARALEGILSGCASTEMVVAEGPAQTQVAEPESSAAALGTDDALTRWDTNGNGRITCKEARQHGIAPVLREHPAYRFMRDGDGDGVVCQGNRI